MTMDKAAQKIKSLQINGKEVSPEKKYSLALPEFIANGGDKYPSLQFRKYGYVDADLLKEYVQKKKKLVAKEFAPTHYIKFE